MSVTYLGIVIFLFLLAIVDLIVGVSNDAVNFLGAAVGSKAASLKKIMIVAAIGILIGATFSNGMMDIARHGIFQPSNFTFNEIMCIYLAVVVSDVILLDVFNSLGLPTSTTVSMVFELLGAAFFISLIKLAGNSADLSLGDLINSSKALSVILAIFVSVGIAFFFGTLVQWISRIVFTFNYKKNLGKKIAIFGSIAATSIVYFMFIKGMKDATFMTQASKSWVDANVELLVVSCFIFFAILMQILYWCKVNVLKIVVLMGTFALALAFAGNDLVNFIGVTMAGYSSFIDFTTNAAGASPDSFMMTSLNQSAHATTPFLVASGVVMVTTLILNKKARRVLQTTVDLSRQNQGDEMFGTSNVARVLVRNTSLIGEAIVKYIPKSVLNWIDGRFAKPAVTSTKDEAAFDLIRATINLVLSGLLIALGTSFKLPLSTTYVAFMVAMGSSLADRAWGRESAVYRVTGVISVIGGWFITAAAAFIIAAISVLIMYFGGIVGMIAMVILVCFILIRSNLKAKKTEKELPITEAEERDMLYSEDEKVIQKSLHMHFISTLSDTIDLAATTYKEMVNGFAIESLKDLNHSKRTISSMRVSFKKNHFIETRGLKRLDPGIAYEKSTWFYLCHNNCEQILYTLLHICNPMREHIANYFTPLQQEYVNEFAPYHENLCKVFNDIAGMIRTGDYSAAHQVSDDSRQLKKKLDELRKMQIDRVREEKVSMKRAYVYLILIQESHELLSEVRNILRGSSKLFQV
jgi:phosphate/sulfate permease